MLQKIKLKNSETKILTVHSHEQALQRQSLPRSGEIQMTVFYVCRTLPEPSALLDSSALQLSHPETEKQT